MTTSQKLTLQARELSPSTYNLCIGLVLLWGIALNVVMLHTVPLELLQSIPRWAFFIGYFALSITGIYIANQSSEPVFSFLGYNLVVVPVGLVICLALPHVPPATIETAAIQTVIALALMVLGATLFPALALGFGRFLFVALLGLVIGQLVCLVFLHRQPAILGVLGVAIFCGYIAYDWARAQTLEKTLDNAIDVACSIYLDILNLFMDLIQLNSND